VLGHGQGLDVPHSATSLTDPTKAGIGAAHVSHQPGQSHRLRLVGSAVEEAVARSVHWIKKVAKLHSTDKRIYQVLPRSIAEIQDQTRK
jgi:hypothetical protein